MWTFERYRRWADDKRDWVLPSAKPLPEAEEPPLATALPPTREIRAPKPTHRPAAPPAEPPSGQLEIDGAEEDLEKLVQDMLKKKT